MKAWIVVMMLAVTLLSAPRAEADLSACEAVGVFIGGAIGGAVGSGAGMSGGLAALGAYAGSQVMDQACDYYANDWADYYMENPIDHRYRRVGG